MSKVTEDESAYLNIKDRRVTTGHQLEHQQKVSLIRQLSTRASHRNLFTAKYIRHELARILA